MPNLIVSWPSPNAIRAVILRTGVMQACRVRSWCVHGNAILDGRLWRSTVYPGIINRLVTTSCWCYSGVVFHMQLQHIQFNISPPSAHGQHRLHTTHPENAHARAHTL